MRFIFKGRTVSFMGSFDIVDSFGDIAYFVEGELGFGYKMTLYDSLKSPVGTVRGFPFAHIYIISIGKTKIGTIYREISFEKVKYSMDYKLWKIVGDFMDCEFTIFSGENEIGDISFGRFYPDEIGSIFVKDCENTVPALLGAIAVYMDYGERVDAPEVMGI